MEQFFFPAVEHQKQQFNAMKNLEECKPPLSLTILQQIPSELQETILLSIAGSFESKNEYEDLHATLMLLHTLFPNNASYLVISK